MAVYRVDVRADDLGPIWKWLEAHAPECRRVRAVGYSTALGGHMNVVFRFQEDAEAFHRQWLPGDRDHTVWAWGERQRPAVKGCTRL